VVIALLLAQISQDRLPLDLAERDGLHGEGDGGSNYDSILNCHSLIFLQVGSRPAAVERSGVDARLGRKRLACNE
jgi:hypothetical protein